MRWLWIAVMFAAETISASASDINFNKVDRSIPKGPPLQSQKPVYMLLLFGEKADRRVWMVDDGDRLFIDRNADGDFAGAGESLIPAKTDVRSPETLDQASFERTFSRVAIAIEGLGNKYELQLQSSHYQFDNEVKLTKGREERDLRAAERQIMGFQERSSRARNESSPYSRNCRAQSEIKVKTYVSRLAYLSLR